MSKVKVKKYSNFWERNRKSKGYLLKRTVMGYGVSICRFLLLFGMCFLILQPILNKISVSFMSESDLYDPVVVSIPQHFTTENYRLAAEIMKYGKGLTNTFVISLTVAVLQIAVCTLWDTGLPDLSFPLRVSGLPA